VTAEQHADTVRRTNFPPGFEWDEQEQVPRAVYYTARETADIIGVTERTVRRWIERGRLKAEKLRGEYRIHLEDARAVNEESRPGLALRRSVEFERIDWLEAENARLWALLEKIIVRGDTA
jgi:excisionase family DNA binding protein